MRLFVAVQLPEDVLDQVDAVSTVLRDGLDGSGGRGGEADRDGGGSEDRGRGEDADAGGRDRRSGDSRARLRWTTREQWHVTLRFLGEVIDPAEVAEALDGLRHTDQSDSSGGASHSGRSGQSSGHGHEGGLYLEGVEAQLRLRPKVLGGSVLCLPVHGLDELAGAVSEATAHVDQPPDPRPFRGHVTLARQRGRQHRRLRLGDIEVPPLDHSGSLRWPVSEVHVMRSHLHRDGSRYETLSTTSLGTGPASSGGPRPSPPAVRDATRRS